MCQLQAVPAVPPAQLGGTERIPYRGGGGQVAPLLCPVRKNGFLQKVPPHTHTQSKQVGEGRGLSLLTCDNRCQNSHVRADERVPTTA